MQVFAIFWLKIKKAFNLRYWTARQAFAEIWRRSQNRSEWSMLAPLVIWSEFVVPFFRGHLPRHYHTAAIGAGFLLKPTPIVSVASIQAKLTTSLADYVLGPYKRTGVLPCYASALHQHYQSCDYCQTITLHEYGEHQRLSWLIHREREEDTAIQ